MAISKRCLVVFGDYDHCIQLMDAKLMIHKDTSTGTWSTDMLIVAQKLADHVGKHRIQDYYVIYVVAATPNNPLEGYKLVQPLSSITVYEPDWSDATTALSY